jgi:hypothetical protein
MQEISIKQIMVMLDLLNKSWPYQLSAASSGIAHP